MPDNKTVTFDASQYQLVPKVPTDEMAGIFMDGGEYPGNRKGKPWVEGSEEWYGDREQFSTDYAAMLDAAPTPAAQSAGQEAIYQAMWHEGDPWVDVPADSFEKYTDDFDVVDLYAAPVTGGEREAALEEAARLIESTNETVTIEGAGDTIRHLTPRKANDAHNLTGRTWAAAIRALKSQRAADAQQVGDLELRLNEFAALQRQIGAEGYTEKLTNQSNALYRQLRAALTSPAKEQK